MRTLTIRTQRPYNALIAPGLLDRAGQEIARVLSPCRAVLVTDDTVDALFLAAHSDMRLVDQRRCRTLRSGVLPAIRRRVDLGAKKMGFGILNDVARVRGNPFAATGFPAHLEPVVVAGPNEVFGACHLPDVGTGNAQTLEARIDLPVGKVAD